MTLPEDPRDPHLKRLVDLGGFVLIGLLVFGLPLVIPTMSRSGVADPALFWVAAFGAVVVTLGGGAVWYAALRRRAAQEAAYTRNLIAWIRGVDDATLEALPPELPPSSFTARLVPLERERRERERAS